MLYAGASPGSLDTWAVARGLKTLGVRVRRQSATAAVLAEALSGHPAMSRVLYPGLRSHPTHDVAVAQMDGFGPLLAVDLAGGADAGRKLVERVHVAVHAASLGGPETMVVHPASTTHARLSPEQRAAAGITDGLVRISVGLEDPEVILHDLTEALA